MQAEINLAKLLGFKNINFGFAFDIADSTLFNRHSEGYDEVLPRWCRDNAASFALMVEHRVEFDLDESGIAAYIWPRSCREQVMWADHKNKESAMRYAISQAVIAKLLASARTLAP